MGLENTEVWLSIKNILKVNSFSQRGLLLEVIYSNKLKTFSETFSYLCQTPKMKLFAKIVEGWKPLAILSKSSIFDVW